MTYILKKEGIEYWLYQDDKLIAHTPMKAKDYFEDQEHYEAYWQSMKPIADIWNEDLSFAFLNLQQIHSLIGIVDVVKKAENVDKSQCSHFKREHSTTQFYIDVKDGYILGYNECLEDNKDKKWTDKDMRVLYLQAIVMGQIMAKNEDYEPPALKEILLQFESKTEWEVEIEEVAHKNLHHEPTTTSVSSPLHTWYIPKITNGYINILKIKS